MQYDKKKNWHKENNRYNWEQGCEYCKGSFGEDERFVRIDVRNGVMRGDDDVYCFHKDCFGAGVQKLEKESLSTPSMKVD